MKKTQYTENNVLGLVVDMDTGSGITYEAREISHDRKKFGTQN